MESLVREGLIAGVLDITTTELADEVVGGFLIGRRRPVDRGRRMPACRKWFRSGATDMVNFYAREHGAAAIPASPALPAQSQRHADADHGRRERDDRRRHRPQAGRRPRGRAVVLLPRSRRVGHGSRKGQPFDDPAARQALFDALRKSAGATSVVELDRHINDPEFAEAAALQLIELMHAG